MTTTEFVQTTIDNNSSTDAIALIKEYFTGQLLESQKKMVFAGDCDACQQTAINLRETIQVIQDNGV